VADRSRGPTPGATPEHSGAHQNHLGVPPIVCSLASLNFRRRLGLRRQVKLRVRRSRSQCHGLDGGHDIGHPTKSGGSYY